jgi:putative flippase GtrA
VTQAGESGERLFRFQLVGLMGAAVQVGTLAFLTTLCGTGYLVSTALAVETAIVHNFAWHERWTWAGRTGNDERFSQRFNRFFKFNATSGAFSIVTNVLLTYVYVQAAVTPYWLANACAIATGSLATFFIADLFVFRRVRAEVP